MVTHLLNNVFITYRKTLPTLPRKKFTIASTIIISIEMRQSVCTRASMEVSGPTHPRQTLPIIQVGVVPIAEVNADTNVDSNFVSNKFVSFIGIHPATRRGRTALKLARIVATRLSFLLIPKKQTVSNVNFTTTRQCGTSRTIDIELSTSVVLPGDPYDRTPRTLQPGVGFVTSTKTFPSNVTTIKIFTRSQGLLVTCLASKSTCLS